MRSTAALFLALALGCSPEFERASEIRTVRVLGVQKDEPYPAPGDAVTLTLLDHDGRARGVVDTNPGRELSRVWLAGCENPPGDLYAGCFPKLVQLAEAEDPLFQYGAGARFSFRISPEIISSRPPPADRFPPYGTVYVFFAVCAGSIQLALDERFPLACYSNEGRRLGADDFVVGYTSLFVYDGFRNENPIITGFEIDGRRVEPDCIGVECVSEELSPTGDGGLLDGSFVELDAAALVDGGLAEGGGEAPRDLDGGLPPPRRMHPDENCDLSGPNCVRLCDEEDDQKCPDIPIRPIIDPASAEVDAVLAAAGQGRLLEQMWINYYVDEGSLASDVRLLNDALKGWNDDYGTDFRAPRREGTARIWAVAHDNRGGAQWVRVSVGVRR